MKEGKKKEKEKEKEKRGKEGKRRCCYLIKKIYIKVCLYLFYIFIHSSLIYF
ncbi:hypothetical protein E1A91_A03G193800v1 [Gossypium mustelinum]|uniref:Uncharacterized protein n=1 Tax=Gossypium mustelinum TaxID=34275 RepID=A0A5D3A360_GOSMU|nr:hypothetical protein E1A91_A03G193800v1 [Gossypium mustelinum]